MTNKSFLSFFPWIWPMAGGGVIAGALVAWLNLPIQVKASVQNGQKGVDPRLPIAVNLTGWGAQIQNLELSTSTGQVVKKISQPQKASDRYVLRDLKPSQHYQLSMAATRQFPQAQLVKTVQFSTLTQPELVSEPPKLLPKNQEIRLEFSAPVIQAEVQGIPAQVELSEDGKTVILKPKDYKQGERYTVEVTGLAAKDYPIAPVTFKVMTPPATTLEASIADKQQNLGVGMPLTLNFSKAPANPEALLEKITVDPLPPGVWKWTNSRTLRYVLEGGVWPAKTTYTLTADLKDWKAADGSWIEEPLTTTFGFGPDHRFEVDLSRQRAMALENGKVVREFKISSGKGATPTVTGTFYIYRRVKIKTMTSGGDPQGPGFYSVDNVPFVQYFHRGYAFHGAWWHNNFGRPMSHGCINMSTQVKNARSVNEDAGWLWKFGATGTPVSVYGRAPGTVARAARAAKSNRPVRNKPKRSRPDSAQKTTEPVRQR
jgi:lipoprotein-anchoring transpeptidase ErfK/SrfK